MTDQLIGSHDGLHSEAGALPGEHPGRSANPVIKVHDVVWLEFEKPDLDKAEAFGRAFGFSVALRTDDELQLRGSDRRTLRADPTGHFADGDMFDNTLEPGWAPMTASGLYQWGPPPSKDFLGVGTARETAREVALMLGALRHDNEFDLSALRGLFAVGNS